MTNIILLMIEKEIKFCIFDKLKTLRYETQERNLFKNSQSL